MAWLTSLAGGGPFSCANLRARWRIFVPLTSPPALAPRGLATTTLYRLCRGLGSWVVAKLRYKGKSFRWYRKRGALVLRFGHSHLVTAVAPLVAARWRRRGRMKILFFGSNFYELRHFLARVIRWRPMNLYHGRGLRFSRQVVYRKAGKVSAYR